MSHGNSQVRSVRVEINERLDALLATLLNEARNVDVIRLAMRTADYRLGRHDLGVEISPNLLDELYSGS
ncbi:hypothetical protein BH10PLA2_BH10PLA2_01160 [soil metagenome]